MGIWELVDSTAESSKRSSPDVTPVKNSFAKVVEPVRSACRNSYATGSATFAKIDSAVRTVRLRRSTPAYEKISGQFIPSREFIQFFLGGRLGVGFTYYKNTFQLTKIGDSETMVDSTVDYVTGSEETSVAPGELVKSAIAFFRDVEALLLKNGPIFSGK